MAKTNTKIRGEQIEAAVAGDALVWDAGTASILSVNVDGLSIEVDTDALQVKVGGITNDMLAGSIADGKLVEDYIKTSEVDDSTIEFGASLNVKAGGIDSGHIANGAIDTVHIADLQVTNGKIADDTIAEVKLDIHNAPDAAKVLGYHAVNGLTWVTPPDTNTFVGLTDTPAAYAGHAGKGVRVNGTPDGLEFYTLTDTDEKVKADSGDATAGFLDAKVDNSSIGVTAHKLYVKALGIATGMIAADAVDGTKIANDAVDSEHIAAAAVDLEHMSANSVDSPQYVDGSIDTAHIANDQITEAKLDCTNATTDGYMLTWDDSTSKFEWIDPAISDNIVEGDILFEDESVNCNGITVDFTLGSTPLANSVQVFLNGLLQQKGTATGFDYDISGTTVTFESAPAATDLLLIHYIADN